MQTAPGVSGVPMVTPRNLTMVTQVTAVISGGRKIIILEPPL